MDEKTITYSNEAITVLWKPDKCVHSGVCVQGLGKVFNPRLRKWINVEAASPEEISSQIDKCPSGALSYRWNNR